MMLPVLAVLALVVAQPDGNSSSYCNDLFYNTTDTLLWHVDHDSLPVLNDLVTKADFFSATDFVVAVDQVIQNTARHSRGRFRHRVFNNGKYDVCDPDDLFSSDACIATVTDSESNICYDDPSDPDDLVGVAAWAGCSGPTDGLNCRIGICSTNRSINWNRGDFHKILAHEFLHNLGVGHVTRQEKDVYGQPRSVPNCPTSDGCERELMCESINASESSIVRQGDGSAVRSSINGSLLRPMRKMAFGSRIPTASTTTTTAVNANREAMFAPRIDCSRANPAKCLGITTTQLADNNESTAVFALTGSGAASGWSTSTVVATSTNSVQLASDVAISADGTKAFFTRVSETNATVTINAFSLTAVTPVVSAGLGYRAAFPVRVAWNADLSGALVLGAEALLDEGPKWRLHKAVLNANNTLTVTPLDFGTLDDAAERIERGIVGDFDFACQARVAGPCVLVATLASTADVSNNPGNYWSRRFTVATNNFVTVQQAWSRSFEDRRSHGIIGVTVAPDGRTFVVAGRQQMDIASNTQMVEMPTPDISGVPTRIFSEKSDHNVCEAASSDGIAFGRSTPHGGYSVSWCATCGGGRLESLHFENEGSGDDFCY
jgi:hypothetical protein